MNETRTARIYALVDDFNDVRYVGSTGLTPEERSSVHHRNRRTDRGNEELNAWLLGLERPPHAVLLQEVAWADRLKAETQWTRYYRTVNGSMLLNKMDGSSPTPELAERKRVNRLGHYRPHTAEGKTRISEGVRRSWVFRKACNAEQARLEAELGFKLYRLPRTPDEYRTTLLASVDEALAAFDEKFGTAA